MRAQKSAAAGAGRHFQQTGHYVGREPACAKNVERLTGISARALAPFIEEIVIENLFGLEKLIEWPSAGRQRIGVIERTEIRAQRTGPFPGLVPNTMHKKENMLAQLFLPRRKRNRASV